MTCDDSVLKQLKKEQKDYEKNLADYEEEHARYTADATDWKNREGKYKKYKYYGKDEGVYVGRYPVLDDRRKEYNEACRACAKGHTITRPIWGAVLCYSDSNRYNIRSHSVLVNPDNYEYTGGDPDWDEKDDAMNSVHFQCKKSDENKELEHKEYKDIKPIPPSRARPIPPHKGITNCCEIIISDIKAGRDVNIEDVKLKCKQETNLNFGKKKVNGEKVNSEKDNNKKNNTLLYAGVSIFSLCICCIFVIIMVLASSKKK